MLQSPPEVVTLVLRQLSDVSTCDTDYHDCRVGLVSCIKMGLGTCWSDVARVELLRVVRLRQSHGNTSDMTSFIEHVCSTAGSFDVVKEIELSCDSGQHGTMFGLEKFDGLRRLSLKGGHWSFGGLGRRECRDIGTRLIQIPLRTDHVLRSRSLANQNTGHQQRIKYPMAVRCQELAACRATGAARHLRFPVVRAGAVVF